jgi:CRISPR-associated protein Csb2
MDGALFVSDETRPSATTSPLVVEAHFLSDRVMAALKQDRSEPEWPLHPARLFSAAVSALHALDEQDEAFSVSEAAIRWLETIGPPEVHAAPGDRIPSMQVFVPINDEAILSKGASRGMEVCLPDSSRRRRGRTFPGVSVGLPVIRYAWQVDPRELTRHRTGLQHVLSRIPYLGRSVNFVLIRMLEIPPDDLPYADQLQRWAPAQNGTVRMRTVAPGRLDRLRELHEQGRAVDQGPSTFYSEAGADNSDEQRVEAPWSRVWTSFAVSGAWTDAADTEGFAKAVRRAINRRAMVAALAAIDPGLRDTAVVPVDPFISGHEPDGTPSRIERLAVVPLANILHKYADGRLLGFALLMPSTATTEQWRLVSEAVFGDERGLLEIRLGNTAVEVRRADRSSKAVGLAPSRYVTTAKTWTTVTPILLSRRPDNGRKRMDPTELVDKVRAQVAMDCVASGLPEPVAVEVSPVSSLEGVGHARSFRQSRSGPPRWATHATISFDRPVSGPLLVGAGRYNGLGLLTPIGDGSAPWEGSR